MPILALPVLLVWPWSKRLSFIPPQARALHVYNIFFAHNINAYDEWATAMRFFESTETHPSNIGNIDVETTYSFGKSVGHPITKLIHTQLNSNARH